MTSPSRNDHERERFAVWGREHSQAVWGYLLAMVRRRDAADDLTQEVFAKAWQAHDRYREEGNARAYLMRIADRLLFDRGRRAGREINLDAEGWKQIEPASPVADPAQSFAAAEASRHLSEALARLSPVERRVILLRYHGQMSFREIAETIDCPLNTALSHCRRSLAALREYFAEKVQ